MTRTGVLGAWLLVLPTGIVHGQAADRSDVDVSAGSLGSVRLELGGWIQTRWAHARTATYAMEGGFSLTRARLDLRGEALDGAVGFRIQPEFSGTPSLRDAYIEVLLWRGASARLGQYPVPFQWRVSPRREQLPESGITQEEFGTPTGRDVGVLIEGEVRQGRMYYALGLYSGEGRNRRLPVTGGYLAALRAGWAMVGWIPRDESDWQRSPETRLAMGVGLEGANRNRGREWGEELGIDGLEADWVTGMIDVQLQRRGLAVTAEAYWRQVVPRPDSIDTVEGWGLGLSTGYTLPTRHPFEGVVRLQRVQKDTDRSGTQLGSVDAGLNLYLRGHGLKIRGYGSRIWRRGGSTTDVLVMDLNLMIG